MFRKSNKKLLKEEKNRILHNLAKSDPGSPEYTKQIQALKELSEALKEDNVILQNISPALVGVLGNLAGIALVMNYERVHIFTTKAFGLAYKPKSF